MNNDRQLKSISDLRNMSELGSCGMVAPMSAEESIQSISADILNMAKHCRGLSASIDSNLFGPTPMGNGQNDVSISCLLDALKEARCTLRETIEELEGINRKL